MQSSTFIAKLVGPMLVVISVGMLTNQDTYHAIISEFPHSGALAYLAGLLSLLAGLAIVNAHNSWRAEWSVIITILGSLTLRSVDLRVADSHNHRCHCRPRDRGVSDLQRLFDFR